MVTYMCSDFRKATLMVTYKYIWIDCVTVCLGTYARELSKTPNPACLSEVAMGDISRDCAISRT